MTTASTQGSKKTKARKTATGKGRKTKAKKEEPVEEVEDAIEDEVPPPPKPTRGKKRVSTAVDDSALTTAEAPASKKRATANRSSPAVNHSVLEPIDDSDMTDAPAPKKTAGRKKGQASTSRARQASTASAASAASVASMASVPGAFPDDDEIERQLEADLERQLSEDDEVTLDSDSERMKRSKGSRASDTRIEPVQESKDYDMFKPAPAELDDDEVEDELKALEAEMGFEEPHVIEEPEEPQEPEELQEPEEPQELHVPKKGRKAGTRKASKQTKAKKAKATPEPVEKEAEEEVEEEIVAPEPEPELEEQLHEDSLVSTGTVVVKNSAAAARLSTGKRGRGRPSKASLASRESTGAVDLVEPAVDSSVDPPAEPVAQPAAKRGRGRPSKASLASRASIEGEKSQVDEAPPKRGRGRPSKKSMEARQSMEDAKAVKDDVEEYATERVKNTKPPVVSFEEPQSSPMVHDVASSPPPSARHLANPPSTPGRVISPAPSARQAAISPSQSPQSSDAENQPPSSKPAASVKRVALAPVAATPTRGSPSKRNVIAGLRSTTAWTELDVEAVLGSPRPNGNKENSAEQFLKQGKTLTSPEQRMTVEEWILHNAGEAEKKLKQECEAMVSRFESEGSKAMRVLEGLVVE